LLKPNNYPLDIPYSTYQKSLKLPEVQFISKSSYKDSNKHVEYIYKESLLYFCRFSIIYPKQLTYTEVTLLFLHSQGLSVLNWTRNY